MVKNPAHHGTATAEDPCAACMHGLFCYYFIGSVTACQHFQGKIPRKITKILHRPLSLKNRIRSVPYEEATIPYYGWIATPDGVFPLVIYSEFLLQNSFAK